jgi:Pyruvate/2-oxoacid:ferredoxin oxidoreductase gamma subunit
VSNRKILEILGGDEEVHRDRPAAGEQMVKIAGFGGQDCPPAYFANCAIAEGLKTTWLPSYGAEMRGGTANASINISHATIGSPIVPPTS